MGICRDQSISALKGLGYNVVRHPSSNLEPLDLIGIQNNEAVYLGSLDSLLIRMDRSVSPPDVKRDEPASDIEGKRSSKMKAGIGLAFLGEFLSALGGKVGVTAEHANARTIEFRYVDVKIDYVAPLDVGKYLKETEVDCDNSVARQYILGNGRLYLVTKTAKSNSVLVRFERSAGESAKVDVSALAGVLGPGVKVEQVGSDSGMVRFQGNREMVFAFQCFEIAIWNGSIELEAVAASSAFLGAEELKSSLIEAPGLLTVSFDR